MVHAKTFHFVEWDQDAGEEELMFLLEGQSKPINDRSKDFQELCYAVKAFSLVHELKKDVID